MYICKDLYYRRYVAFERKFEPNSSSTEAIDRVVELELTLITDFHSELLPRFRIYSNAVADWASITDNEDFAEGFRLGGRIMVSAFSNELGDTLLPFIKERKWHSIHAH